jgi:peptidoglycan/LPS O-acetylase OafA/YrhL
MDSNASPAPETGQTPAAPVPPTVPLRSSTKPQRDPALDGLRGLAVLMVFAFHYGGGLQSPNPLLQTLGYVTSSGWVGVVLFFCLSGFLITGSLWDSMGEKRLLVNFYMRRVLRILPLYFLALLAATLCTYFLAGRTALKSAWVYLFFLQDLPFLNNYVQATPLALPLYHFWSLAVEEQFYLLWPVLLLAADTRRTARRYAVVIFFTSLLFCCAVWWLPVLNDYSWNGLFDQFVLTYAGALALGAAVALAMRSKNRSGRVGTPRRFVQKWAPYAFAGGLAVYLAVSWACDSLYLTEPLQFTVALPAVAVACVALIPIVLRHGLTRSLFSLAPLAWLGRISYGFYVFHILLQPLFDFITVQLTHAQHGSVYQTVRLCVAFSITLPVSWLSYRFFERPILRLNRHFPMGRPVPTVISASTTN